MSKATLDMADTAGTAEPLPFAGGSSRWAWLRYIARDKKALAGLIMLGVFTLAAFLAPVIAPYDPNAMDFDMIGAPSWAHPLGTDDLGRDLLSRIIHGAQVSLFVGVSTVLIALVAGVALGVAAGYFGGFVDTVIMRYIDLQWAFPNFIIAVYLVAVFGTGLSNVIVAIALAFVDDFARIARAMVLSIKEEQYVAAARTVGASDFRIMWRHILPNAIYPVLIMASMDMGSMVITASFLSFVGLGAPKGYADWGQMVALARNYIVGPPDDPLRFWYTIAFPGGCIILFVLAWNLIGDALRDAFDPKLRRR